MASHLHVRKKQHSHRDLDIPESPNSGGAFKEKKSKNPFLAACTTGCKAGEVRYALSAVGAFLSVGLFLGFFLLHHQHRKVILHVMTNPWAHGGAVLKGRVGFRHHFYSGAPRFVTVVMPSVVAPDRRNRRLHSIQDTWGPYARAIYVVHNVTEFPEAQHAVISEESDPEDPYSYPQLLLVPPSIPFESGLPRLNHVLRTVYERVDPDFAFFVNDHTFVIPEHLCYYLENKDPLDDMYAGHALKNGKDVFNSGAAGYILSRSTLKKLLQKQHEGDPHCSVQGNDWLQGNPGLATTTCLAKALGIYAIDTRRHGKFHRFHAFPLTRMVTGAVDQWYINKHQDMHTYEFMHVDESYSTLEKGVNCCAPDTVSFHYVEFKESLALFSARQALLTNPTMSDHELKALMLAEWPSDFKEIGGYSRGLPKEDDIQGWGELLYVMRLISSRQTQRDC